MPVVHMDAKKRARQSLRRAARNAMTKTRLKSQSKKLLGLIKAADKDQAPAELRETASLFDKAAAKGVIHKNAASRKKARMAKRLRTMGAVPAKTGKAAAKKSPAKAKKS